MVLLRWEWDGAVVHLVGTTEDRPDPVAVDIMTILDMVLVQAAQVATEEEAVIGMEGLLLLEDVIGIVVEEEVIGMEHESDTGPAVAVQNVATVIAVVGIKLQPEDTM